MMAPPAFLAGVRIVPVAKVEGGVAGSVQLDCETPPNKPRRRQHGSRT
jgi:hypothetical protein